MTPENSDALDYARHLRDELGGQRLTPAFAKTYSEHVLLRNGQPGLAGWSERDFASRMRDVVALVEAGFTCRDAGDEWQPALKRAGELLEWLNHPETNGESLPLSLLGAACYQLAGYPARAAGLIRQHSSSGAEGAVLRSLLGGDFQAVLDESLAMIAASEAVDATETQRLAFVEFARGLAVVAADLRWGDEARLQAAVGKLGDLQGALAPFLDSYTWLVLRLCAESTAVSVASSLRRQLVKLEEITTDEGSTVLDRYARFAFVKGRSLAWPSQIRGYDRLAKPGSFALCAPTGSGKTAVAEVALLLGLFERGNSGSVGFDIEVSAPLCLYIVPTRALAAEVEAKLSAVLKSVGGPRAVTVTGLYGGTDWGPADVWLTKDEPTVLICTQEKAEALVRFFGYAFLHRLRLVIVDEAHEVRDQANESGSGEFESRALRLENLIGRLRTSLEKQGTRFIAISAVAHEIEKPLAQWISGDTHSEPLRSDYRSTRQLLGRLICAGRKSRIAYDRLDGSPLEFDSEGNEGPFVPNAFPPHPPLAEEMKGVVKGVAPYTLWAALNLAGGGDEGEAKQSVLISLVTQRANFMKWILRLLEEDWAEEELPAYFEEVRIDADRQLWENAEAMCRDYFGEDSLEYRLLQHRIVVHHGKMPGRLPGLLVRLIDRKLVRVVVATSTLSQGVNLPFETVLIPTLRRYPNVIPGREFGNLIGRAGRPGVSTEGQALVLLQASRRQSFNDYRQVLAELESKEEAEASDASGLARLIRSLRRAFQTEQELIQWLESVVPVELPEGEGGDEIEALDVLDGILIANLEESASRLENPSIEEVDELLAQAWSQTFARYSAADEERLRETYLRRGRAVFATVYPDAGDRRRYYKASLPPRDGTRLFDLLPRAVEHLSRGEEYPSWESVDRFKYVEEMIELVGEMPRFALPPQVGSGKTPWRVVLEWWLLPDAESQPTPNQVADWHSFVGNHFSYQFNWALGALVSLITEDAGEGMLSPEDWGETGMPWIVIWIKEMVMWGTLEPVASYLLARGLATTRAEAEERALDYYAFRNEEDGGAPLLHPEAVRNWASSEVASQSKEAGERPPDRIDVALEHDLNASQLKRSWRVLPVARNDQISWTDPAGYVLASCASPPKWRNRYSQSFDFFLEPQSGQVVSREFL